MIEPHSAQLGESAETEKATLVPAPRFREMGAVGLPLPGAWPFAWPFVRTGSSSAVWGAPSSGPGNSAELGRSEGVETPELSAEEEGEMLPDAPAAGVEVVSEPVAADAVGADGGPDWRSEWGSPAAALDEVSERAGVPSGA